MKRNLVLFVMMAALIFVGTEIGQAEGDTNSTFIMGVASVLAAQNQDIEDVTSTFQLDVIRPIPRIPWHIYGMVQYSQIQAPGKNDIDVNARLIAFSGDPNGPERDGSWVAFLTLGGIKFYDNDESEDSRLIPTNTDGSLGLIGPISGINWILELGMKRLPNRDGKMETYLSIGLGFLGIPKLPVKL